MPHPELPSFLTGFVVDLDEAQDLKSITTPSAWFVSTVPEPSHRFFTDGRGGTWVLEKPDPLFAERAGNTPMSALVLHAQDEDTATNIVSLIHGGTLLGYPSLYHNPATTLSLEIDSIDPSFLTRPPFSKMFNWYDGRTALGCRVASIAWDLPALIYAIHKYRFSVQTDWFTPHSASPRHGQVFANARPDFEYHVTAAMAITAAYSCIEELGLEMRSSKENPRFVDGKLNPRVVENLDRRLRAANMHANLKFTWIQRGSAEPLELSRKEQLGEPSEYHGWRDVRDIEVTLAEAIHLVSWLRNFHTGHKFSELTRALSPYDVHNCQSVARRLLLGALNLWQGRDDGR